MSAVTPDAPTQPTAGCARCGSCCDPVIIDAATYSRATWQARSQEHASPDHLFITQHWRPIDAWDAEDGTPCLSMRCDAFDADNRLCGAHDDRPPVCRRFPWYGDQPSAARAASLSPHCSFLADVPPADRPAGSRPLIPITPVAREKLSR